MPNIFLKYMARILCILKVSAQLDKSLLWKMKLEVLPSQHPLIFAHTHISHWPVIKGTSLPRLNFSCAAVKNFWLNVPLILYGDFFWTSSLTLVSWVHYCIVCSFPATKMSIPLGFTLIYCKLINIGVLLLLLLFVFFGQISQQMKKIIIMQQTNHN